MILALLTLPGARACECAPGGRLELIAPVPGSIGVARNTRVRVWGTATAATGPFEVFEDGIRRDDVTVDVRLFGYNGVSDIVVATPFAPGATVEVGNPEVDVVWTSFEVGDDLDEAPPSWSGQYDTESENREFYDCDRLRSHTFSWHDLADDHTPTSELLAVLEPFDDQFLPVRGWGDTASVAYWLCAQEDPTLILNFHRRYEVTFEDLAGNRSEPVPVNTRGCGSGCATPGSSPGSPAPAAWLVLAGLAAVRRRSR